MWPIELLKMEEQRLLRQQRNMGIYPADLWEMLREQLDEVRLAIKVLEMWME